MRNYMSRLFLDLKTKLTSRIKLHVIVKGKFSYNVTWKTVTIVSQLSFSNDIVEIIVMIFHEKSDIINKLSVHNHRD